MAIEFRHAHHSLSGLRTLGRCRPLGRPLIVPGTSPGTSCQVFLSSKISIKSLHEDYISHAHHHKGIQSCQVFYLQRFPTKFFMRTSWFPGPVIFRVHKGQSTGFASPWQAHTKSSLSSLARSLLIHKFSAKQHKRLGNIYFNINIARHYSNANDPYNRKL